MQIIPNNISAKTKKLVIKIISKTFPYFGRFRKLSTWFTSFISINIYRNFSKICGQSEILSD